MGGIVSYFHGEIGKVTDAWWGTLRENLAYQLELADNAHRTVARDYGTDIGIDPALQPGDTATYLRLDSTCGVWLRQADRHGKPLRAGIERARGQRHWMDRWKSASADTDEIRQVAMEILQRTGAPLRVVVGDPQEETLQSGARFFLSYSSKDSLLARQVHRELLHEAGVPLWFDMAQPSDAVPNDQDGVAAWLESSVGTCQGLILLHSASARASGWVQHELAAALSQRRSNAGLRIVVLQADDTPVPPEAAKAAQVVDLGGLWWSRGLTEELFAAVHGREGRRAWLAAEPDWLATPDQVLRHADFATEAGTVRSFEWKAVPVAEPGWCQRELNWNLEVVDSSGQARRFRGCGADSPVDLGIQPGDRVASFRTHMRWGTTLASGLPLWMRSADLSMNSDHVLDRYYAELGVNPDLRPSERRARLTGDDLWGRALAKLELKVDLGPWLDLETLEWALLREGVSAQEVIQGLLQGGDLQISDERNAT